jgi:hypothetical protein
MCAADRPRSARFESARRLRSFTHWFLSYTFSSRSPNPRRLAVPTRPGFVRTASALTGVPRIRLSSASPGCCDSPAARSFTPLGFIALRGARTDHRTGDEDHHEPSGAVWSGSPVPVAPPDTARAPIRRCSPTASRHSSLLPADLLAPFAMCTPLACSDYYGASAPPHGHRSTTDPPATGPAARREGDHGWFPRSPRNRSMREAPALTPTASPRLRRSPSA